MDTARRALARLAEAHCVISDGDWVERFSDRLLDPLTAAIAGRECVRDDDARDRAAICETLWTAAEVPREAFTAALREVWLDFGLSAPPEYLAELFSDARRQEEILMKSTEIRELHALPDIVTAYRGQIFSDGKHPAGASWTLSKEVANWYAAPVPMLDQPHGWVLTAHVPKIAVLALFLERGEREVVLNLQVVNRFPVEAERGTCDEFPEHLTMQR